MNVLSLFDGMSCGQIALERACIPVETYYASEIKKHAIALTQHNYPNTVQIGSVTELDFNKYKHIDLLIGGSPCQDFSRANRHETGRQGLKGKKSSLFFKWLEALKTIQPKYFLLENVKMAQDQQDIISEMVGVEPININSSLVSAQLRNRLYWTNIPQKGLPVDKGITFQSVLDSGYTPKQKSRCLICSEKNVLKTAVKRHYRFVNYLPINNVWKSKEHFDICQSHFQQNYKGLKSKEITEKPELYEGIRELSRRELERLQTVPEGYTDILTRNQAADLLGDGWTVDVIVHLLQGLKP